MIDYFDCKIERVSAHQVGNQANEENLVVSESPIEISDNQLKEALLNYFVTHFSTEEFFQFAPIEGDLNANPVYKAVTEILEDPSTLHQQSIDLADRLYECQNHPNIKAGDFYVTLLTDIQLDGVHTNAVGLFKAETKDLFIKLHTSTNYFELSTDVGTRTSKLDKGCLVFNTNKASGYKVCVIDKSNKITEAQYWKEEFLNTKPCNDDFHNTQTFMKVTKDFVTKQMPKQFEMDKTDQADLLNRSIDFFKSNQQFNDQQFGNEIFEDEQVINAFHRFKNDFQEEKEVELAQDFGISAPAVQKNQRVFKSVIKLDKNFHIYVHGDKKLIERGVDEMGRKFYKVYYHEET